MPRDFDTVPDGLITKSEGNTQAPAADDAVAKALSSLTTQVTDALKTSADAVAALKADFEGYKADIEKKFEGQQKPPEQKPEGRDDTQKAAADDAVTKDVAALKDELAAVKTALNRPGIIGKAEEQTSINVGDIAIAIAGARGDADRAAETALKKGDERGKLLSKALATGSQVTGGALVPEDYVSQMIELLTPHTVVRSSQPITMPMPNGNLTMPRQVTASQATYIGENQPIPVSQPGFGQIKLSWKKLAVLVPISNDLIRYSSPQASAVVQNDVLSAMARREDIAFLRGAGLADDPKGLLNWCPAGQKITSSGTLTLDAVTDELENLQLLLENANVPFTRPIWFFSPRTAKFLRSIRDASGHYAFRAEMATGKLNGFPFKTTTLIPSTLGAGGDESEIYLVDMSQAVIGDSMRILIDTSTEAAYMDGATVVPTFSVDQTVVRALASHDFNMRHLEAVAVLDGVKWK